MCGLSNGENIFDLRCPLKVKGQGVTLKTIEERIYSSLQLIIYIQNPHKTVGGPLLAALAAAMCTLLLPNSEGSHSVRLFK